MMKKNSKEKLEQVNNLRMDVFQKFKDIKNPDGTPYFDEEKLTFDVKENSMAHLFTSNNLVDENGYVVLG